MVKKIIICLSTLALIGMLTGCSSQIQTVSDEDLQMPSEMRDELIEENKVLKEEKTEEDEEALNVAIDEEDSIDGDLESVDENIEKEQYFVIADFEYDKGVATPKEINFEFTTDDGVKKTGNLMSGASVRYLDRERYDKRVPLSQEHLNLIRNVFIDIYDTIIKDQQDYINGKYLEFFSQYEYSEEKLPNEKADVFPDSFELNFDGKKMNAVINDAEIAVGSISDFGISNEYAVKSITLFLRLEMDDVATFKTYLSSMIAEDAGQEFDYGDYSFIENVIQVDTPDSADIQENNTEVDDGSTVETIIGTWYSTSDATVITFDENGNYTSNNPNTGEHSSLKYYHAGGNRYTAYLEDYFDVDYYLKGDTLVGEEGSYKKK